MITDCLFCKIAYKETPSYTVYEDDDFIAFLSIYPNTEGVTVVIPKKHYSSDIFEMEDHIISDLMIACKKVSKILKETFADVGRVGLIFEGLGVNHLHAKLFPLHGTADIKEKWRKIASENSTFFKKYKGFISSHDCKSVTHHELQKIHEKIRRVNYYRFDSKKNCVDSKR